MLFVLLCLLYGTAVRGTISRFDFYDDYYPQLFDNDPNLNSGFDIEAFRQHQLDLHNHYRHKHGIALMTLDSTLTQQAQEYAEELALNDEGLVHCFNVLGCDYDGAGENLASAEGYTEVEANASVMWYKEIWDYNFCTTGTLDRHRLGHEGRAIGHFTQLVWELTTLIGVGYARTSDRFKVYIVARYQRHGNVIGQYDRYVRRPAYILDVFQDNCYGIDGGLSDWMGPAACTRSCGGGVTFLTKSCTNPKPSLNGRDCGGETKELVPEWCNTRVCSGELSHRDLQCLARREAADAYNFGATRDCQLHCRISDTHFLLVGHVDDGTHCDSDSGACVGGSCYDMPDYAVGTQPPVASPITTSVVIGNTTIKPGNPTTTPRIATTKTTSVTTKPGIATAKQATTTTTSVPSTQQGTTPSPTPASRLVEGAFNQILRKRYQRLVTIPSGAMHIVVQNSKPRNARISVRFQKGNKKPTRYRKKYGEKMRPFSEQVGRGNDNIMPMVCIEGPVEQEYKIIFYIKRRRKRTVLVTWHYVIPN